ncbi:MAG: energy transducer TonB [Panacagrimonas sp.]
MRKPAGRLGAGGAASVLLHLLVLLLASWIIESADEPAPASSPSMTVVDLVSVSGTAVATATATADAADAAPVIDSAPVSTPESATLTDNSRMLDRRLASLSISVTPPTEAMANSGALASMDAIQGPDPRALTAFAQADVSPDAPAVLPGAYFARLSRIIRVRLDYPRQSRDKGEQGLAVVRMTLAPDGTVIDAVLHRGSNFPLLDAEALSVIRRIGKFPPLPADVAGSGRRFVVDQPIRFGFS